MMDFKKDIEDRITNVKKCNIPDLGQTNHVALFEEFKNTYLDENGDYVTKPKPSYWSFIYDSIKMYPRFQRMKDYITKCKEEKLSEERIKQQVAFKKYLDSQKQRYTKKKFQSSTMRAKNLNNLTIDSIENTLD